MSILDLSGADTSGFDAVDAGSYNCTVYEIEVTETSGQGKLPQGVPMVRVQFAAQDEGVKNRRFFNNYPIPTEEQHASAALMQGNFVKFLTALGYDENKIKSKGFDLEKEADNLIGRECVVRVGKEAYKRSEDAEAEWTNPVKSVKPAGSPTGGQQSTDLL